MNNLHSNRFRTCWRGWPLIFLGGLALLLAGCAANPYYDTYTRFTPPTGSDAQACLAECDRQLQQCLADCAEQRQQCITELEPEIEKAYRSALDQYETERQYYEKHRAEYEQSLRFNWGYGRRYCGWPGFYYPYWVGSGFWMADSIPLRPPSPPKAPSESAIRAQIIEQQCELNCDCQGRYEQCFIGCGGQIERFTVCIADCGPDDPRPPEGEFRPGLNLPTSTEQPGF